mmetsp:Transcript_29143/g.42790  ORF Transcript_29143/g.42790 Transcript_29143/m.42790 type:complete len:975 (-) Transcript_29143:351-3275(-)|eukprot:CAMPEP_0116018464 /NCGR_PEP_ID=MMETSP0321-20121206/8664_1 /TAXON_ID=163516 /ORGANISM="Leptocylindrus danicus var. danicus, Strain B650" /LENGTH=974 /DNA_ID=CAMNT_0003488863 /DNA_START=163 /DNA_END=3087 /DNA_ORIENTATION=+
MDYSNNIQVSLKDLAQSSGDRTKTMNALRGLKRALSSEKQVIQEGKSSFDLFISHSDAVNNSIAAALLEVASSNDVEACRETSASILCESVSTLVMLNSSCQKSDANMLAVEQQLSCVVEFYEEFCSVFDLRFSSKRDGLFVESSEEIRFVLIQIAHNLAQLLGTLSWSGIHDSLAVLPTAATSTLCRSVANALLRDPYPELKREGCTLIKCLCKYASKSVRMQAESLLAPLASGKIKYQGGSQMTREEAEASRKSSLLCHRHAKTRAIAIETGLSVLECSIYSTQEDLRDADGSSDDIGNDGDLYRTPLHAKPGSSGAIQMIETQVIPAWEECMFDRVASVRKTLVQAAGKLAVRLLQTQKYNLQCATSDPPLIFTRLLVILLMGASDGVNDVQHISLDQLTKLSKLWSKGDGNDALNYIIPAFFPHIVEVLIQNATDWKVDERCKALESLGTALKMLSSWFGSKDASSQIICSREDLTKIISTLCICSQDDESAVEMAACNCAQKLSGNNELASFSANITLERLRSDGRKSSGYSTPEHVSATLLILSNIMMILPEENSSWIDLDVLNEVSAVLSDRTVLDLADHFSVMSALSDAVKALVEGCPEEHFDQSSGDERFTVNILRSSLQLLGCPADFDLEEDVLDIINLFSSALLVGEIQNDGEEILLEVPLLSCHFRELLTSITNNLGSDDVWVDKDPNLLAFEALLRFSGGNTVCQHLDMVEPILRRHLSDGMSEESSIDHGVKMKMLGLVESAISGSSDQSKDIQPFAAKLIENVIIPNLAWRAGGIAAGIRKLALACLFSLLRRTGQYPDCLFQTAPRLLPVLRTNIDDSDSSTRQLVCLCLAFIFQAIPGALGEDAVHQLYPSLIKCLDDNSDEVRVIVCGTLAAFLKASPSKSFHGTAIDVIVEQLLVHMDDPDKAIQKAVFDALVVTLSIDCGVVIKQTERAKLSHRSSKLCDELLSRAREIAQGNP